MVQFVTWHNFRPSTDNDSECVNPDCGVIVEDSSLRAYTAPCPAPACTDPSNHGNACVIVGGPGGPMCAYCERRHGYDEDDDDEGDYADVELDADEDLDELNDELAPLAGLT